MTHSPSQSQVRMAQSASVALTSSSHDTPHVLLSFQDITYGMHVGGQYRNILRGVTGYVESGTMLAILGPSGAGKTTLLDVLAQRRTKGLSRGTVCLNGHPIDATCYRRQRGYVQQEDLFYSFLTVEETVRFAATLRTPPSFSSAEIEARVQRVIQLLGIDNVRHCRIGNSLVRGISGGEKKRCAVAAELVTAPSLLLLDEPTTGLDTFTALHLLSLLKSLAQSGMAVVFSIHQPRASIYQLFDRVLLLNAAGEQAYFGPAVEAVPFFESLGVRMSFPQNPADFLLDAVSSLDEETAAEYGPYASHIPPPTQGRDIAAAFQALRADAIEAELAECLRVARRHEETSVRHGYPEGDDEGDAGRGVPVGADAQVPLLSPYPGAADADVDASPYFRGTWTQIRVVATRCVLNTMRDPIATIVSVSVAMVFALLIGSIYYRVGQDQESIRSRMGVLFFVMMNTTFSSLGNLDTYLTGRALYTREHGNGMYSAGAYYIGKMVQDVPFGILVNTAFNAAVYLLVGLQLSWYRFVIFDVVCVLVMLNSYGLCLLVSNLAKNYATANITASLLLVLYLLPTGGMLVSLDKIPLVWRWIKYVSFVRYAFAAVVANEFTGLTLTCPELDLSSVTAAVDGRGEDGVPLYPCVRSGTAYADSLSFHDTDVPWYVVVLTASFVIYLLLGYLVLRFWRSTER